MVEVAMADKKERGQFLVDILVSLCDAVASI